MHVTNNGLWLPSFSTRPAMSAPRRRNCSFLFKSYFGSVLGGRGVVETVTWKETEQGCCFFVAFSFSANNSQALTSQIEAQNGSQVIRISEVKQPVLTFMKWILTGGLWVWNEANFLTRFNKCLHAIALSQGFHLVYQSQGVSSLEVIKISHLYYSLATDWTQGKALQNM